MAESWSGVTWRVCGMLVMVLAWTGCGQELGCQGEGFAVGTAQRIEPNAVVDPGTSVVVTHEGAQLLADQFVPIAAAFLGGQGDGRTLDLSAFINDFLVSQGFAFAGITLEDVVMTATFPHEDGIQVSFLEGPTRVHITIDELWVNLEATVTDPTPPVSFACRVRGKLDKGTPMQRMFTVRDVVLDIELGQFGEQYNIQVSRFDFELPDSGIDVVADRGDPDYYCNYDVCSDGASGCSECVLICGAASLVEDVFNFFAEFLDGVVGQVIETVVNGLLSGIDRLEGEIHPAVLLGTILPDLLDTERIAFGLRPARQAFSAPGPTDDKDLAIQVGLGTAPRAAHPCIGLDPGTPRFAAGRAPEASDDLVDIQRAHMALGLPQATLNQLLWSIYRAGGLCLQITSDDITRLSSAAGGGIRLTAGTVSLLLPGLDTVVGKDTPLMLSIQPAFEVEHPDIVTYGTGQGEGDARDSLVNVDLPRMEIGIHAWVEGRWLRLFAVAASIGLGVTPIVHPDGRVDIALDRITVDGLSETYSELFAGAQLEALFTYVIELALGALLGQGIEFPLPLDDLLANLLGVPLRLEFTGMARGGASEDWLQLGVRLGLGQGAAPERLALDTRILRHTAILRAGDTQVSAVLEAVGPDGERWSPEDVELIYRVDAGVWRTARAIGTTSAGALKVELPSQLLMIEGDHRLQVVARPRSAPTRIDPSPAEADLVTLPAPLAAAAVEPPAESVASPTVGGGGCSVTAGAPAGRSGVWLFALLGVVGLALRRRRACVKKSFNNNALLCGGRVGRGVARAGLVLLLTLGAFAAAACDDDAPTAQTAITCEGNRDCPAGLVCGCASVCYLPRTCEVNRDCCAGESCSAGQCVETRECDSGSDCGEGSVCAGCLCRLRPCDGDADCADGRTCVDGACESPSLFACPTDCNPGDVCVPELQRCTRLPSGCEGVRCADDQILVVTGASTWIGAACDEAATVCTCRDAAGQVISGEPSGYLGAQLTVNGQIALAAYDMATRDLTFRWVDPVTNVPTPPIYLDGLPDGASNLSEQDRAELAPGPDVGAELDIAVDDAGTIGIVSIDRDRATLRLAVSRDGVAWRTLDVATGDVEPAAPDLEAVPGGGWLIAFQGFSPRQGEQSSTSLRLAVTPSTIPTGAGDFQVSSLDDRIVARPYADLPVGTGVTPALARLGDRWFLLYHDADVGSLELATWRELSNIAGVRVLDPSVRGELSGGSTGLAPRVVASGADRLDVLYLDTTSGELRHARFRYDAATNQLRDLTVALVDPGLAAAPQRSIALDAQLLAAPNGKLLALYQDATFADLYLATSTDAGATVTWDRGPWSEEGGAGFFPQAVFASPSAATLIYGKWIFPGPGLIQQALLVQPKSL